MKCNKLKQALSAAVLITISLPALAADSIGWYLGGSLGEAKATIAQEWIIDDLLTSGFTSSNFQTEDQDFGYKVFAGYQFGRNFALEGGYLNLGEFGYSVVTTPAGSVQGDLKLQGWNLDAVFLAPLNERSSLFARLGVHRSKASDVFSSTGNVTLVQTRMSETATNAKLGIGYQHSITDKLDFRLEAERYRLDDAVSTSDGDIDLVSVGLVYRFAPAEAARSVVVPRVPAASAAAAPAASAEYCSELNIEFEIQRDSIEIAEQEKLAVLATFLTRYPQTSAVIEGHTDSVGSDELNQQLSQRRAQSVVDYLVRTHQIDRSRLTAVGFGESRPIADNQTEEGKRANRRINAVIGCASDIAGLQPLPARVTFAMQMEFDANSAVVRPMYREQLGSVARFLVANPTVTARLQGHADNVTPDMAQQISDRRAQNVANYLVDMFGVDRSRLSVQGFADTRDVAYNLSSAGRQENRRVNIIFDYPK